MNVFEFNVEEFISVSNVTDITVSFGTLNLFWAGEQDTIGPTGRAASTGEGIVIEITKSKNADKADFGSLLVFAVTMEVKIFISMIGLNYLKGS